jgi:hypothetical protein
MQTVSPLRRRLPEFRKAAHDLKVWVLELCAWVVAFVGGRDARLWVQRQTLIARHRTRELIFLAMVAQLSFRSQAPRPGGRAPTGCDVRIREKYFRPVALYTRGIRLRTLGDIRRALAHFDAVVRRALKRLPKIRAFAETVAAVRPRAIVLVAQTCGPEREAADTS